MLDSSYEEDLEDGKVRLFVRNGIFQARYYKGNRRYIFKSLKTRKLDEARKLGLRFLHELEFKQQENLPLQHKTFSDVLNEYIKLREQQFKQSQNKTTRRARKEAVSASMLYQIKRVSKFWHEYCGKMSVARIDNGVLQDYVQWRKDYYLKMAPEKRPRSASLHPADATLKWETTFAKTVLRFAHERNYRGQAQLPTWFFKTPRRVVRPAFSPAEYRRIYERMRAWIRETDNPEYKYTRELLRDYVLILANSGMRVGEANSMKESDVEAFVDELGRKNYMLRVKGKTGERIVIPRVMAVRYIERVLERNKKRKADAAANIERNVRAPKRKRESKDDWFFTMYDGNKIVNLIDQFQTVLSSINLLTNRNGERYTLYSLRHFYAVSRLRKSIPVFDLARNMGTSVQIIEQYYGKDATSLALAAQLGS